MVIIHYSAASCCCVPSLHRSSPSRSILAPAIFFFRDAAPNLRLVSVWSQPPGSEGFGEPNKHSSRDASVGFSASSSSVIDFLTLCHRLKVTLQSLTTHFSFNFSYEILWSIGSVFYVISNSWSLNSQFTLFCWKEKSIFILVDCILWIRKMWSNIVYDIISLWLDRFRWYFFSLRRCLLFALIIVRVSRFFPLFSVNICLISSYF